LRLKSRERIEAENLALRHQLNVVCRSARKRVRLCSSDRLLFIWRYWLWPGVLDSVVIIQPKTVVCWHRRGFKAFWRWKSRGRPGRQRIPREVLDLIREISLANPLWGAPGSMVSCSSWGSRWLKRPWRSTWLGVVARLRNLGRRSSETTPRALLRSISSLYQQRRASCYSGCSS
jgi:hypothetical protein